MPVASTEETTAKPSPLCRVQKKKPTLEEAREMRDTTASRQTPAGWPSKTRDEITTHCLIVLDTTLLP